MAVGVPLITHPGAVTESPEGRAGEEVQPVMVSPPLFKVVGVTDIGFPTAPVVPVEPE